MTDPRPDELGRTNRQFAVMGIFAVCILVLIQIFSMVLLTGRMEHVRQEVKDLTRRVEALESRTSEAAPKPLPAPVPAEKAPAVQPAKKTKPPQPAADEPPPAKAADDPAKRLADLLDQADAEVDRPALEKAVGQLADVSAAKGKPDQDSSILMARAHWRLGQNDLAKQWLQRAGPIPSDHFAGQLLTGRILLGSQEGKVQAEVALQNAMRGPATRLAAAKLLGGHYLDRNQTDLAAKTLAAVKTAKGDEGLTVLRGRLAVRQGHYDEAVRLLTPIIKKSPDHADGHLWLGVAKLRQNRIDDSWTHFVETQRAARDRPEGAFWLGVVQLRRHKPDQASKRFQEAIDISSRYAPAWTYLGIALVNKDRIDDAIKKLNEAIRLDPDQPEPFFVLATCYARNKDAESAAAALHRAVRLDPAFGKKAAQAGIFEDVLDEQQRKALLK